MQFSFPYSFFKKLLSFFKTDKIELIWAQVIGFVAENNTTFRLKDVKELVYGGFGRNTREVWAKAEDRVS
jgi:hypothetical protein